MILERNSLWLPLAILLVLAGLSFWIERSVQLPDGAAGTDKIDPEGIMENFDALRTDLEGNPQYRLSARRLKHYSGSKLTELEEPHFTRMDARTGEIDAVAREARVSADGNEIDLRGKVVVTRAARPGQSTMTLRTERLLVFQDRDLLQAPGPVNVTDDTLTVDAGAMEYRAGPRIVKLSGRVKTRYLSKAK